ncbi:LOW QUALITY PROTEIN: target of EGR1 protein 1 [Aquarana catesbeiana]|uniref:LOW QUALITY PROTEIN: target of EGR1 protein 1 n=1 Tax=Aquarana catesbeiana TaxID=8400 RepID=UPI003CC9F772
MTTLRVPVIDIYNDNFSELWPSVLLALKTSTFIAVDTELSGLGSRKSLLNQCIEERYKAICHAARTRSVISLGIACFKELPEKGKNVYLSQIYNLTLLCMEDYTIEPQSVQFLVQHGFDFNKQYSCGIPYYKGNDKGDERRLQSVRTLFLELLQARKPLILHNGLIDLAFLYQSFYAQLPEKIMNFVADLSEMFPAGIYDTKYASEFETRFTASYLEYAYKKCKRENIRRIDSSTNHLSIEFCHYTASMSAYVDYRLCSLPNQEPAGSATEGPHICDKFSAYGWCPNGSKCVLSHNIDLIIDEDEKGRADKKKRRRKRKKTAAQEETPEEVSMEPPCRKPNMDPSDTPEGEEKGEEHLGSLEPPCSKPLSDPSDTPEEGKGEEHLGSMEPPCSKPLVDPSDTPEEGKGEEHLGSMEPPCSKPLVDPSDTPEEGKGQENMETEKEDCLMEETVMGQSETKDLPTPRVSSNQCGDHTGPPATVDTDLSLRDDQTSKPIDEGPHVRPPKRKAPSTSDAGTHRAGFDAFMTGYILAYVWMLKRSDDTDAAATCLPDCQNKIYLSGKNVPLQIIKSVFAKCSRAHMQKIKLVMPCDA